MWWNLNTENLWYNKEVWELFEGLSTWKKWVRYTQEWINMHWEEYFYLLRSKWFTPSEIVKKSEQDVFFILEG